MEVEERARYEKESQDVRNDLKLWESTWAKDHQGVKPGRDDIKQNPVIAQKYKLYNKIRDILSGKALPSRKDKEVMSRKRKPTTEVPSQQTPSKRQKTAATPSMTRFASQVATPSTARKLFSPHVPTSIGPTPQRDGRVLGLFDLLSATPSKSTDDAKTAARSGRRGIQSTPSKPTHTLPDDGDVDSKTPRRRMFATPLKAGDAKFNAQNGVDRTPTSVSKLQFSTPAFLRRAPPMPSLDENGEFTSPPRAARGLPRKPLVRGLSSVVASLRKMEEEALDEELEALHEMEAAESAGAPVSARGAMVKSKPSEEVQVADSQVQRKVLIDGMDDEGLYDSAPEDQLGRDGQPLRVYKKKGQKRTTRRVNMRPTRMKRPATEDPTSGDEDEDEGVVPETQYAGGNAVEEFPEDVLSGSDFAASDDEGATSKKQKGKPKKADGAIKKAVKKVSAAAHQNFRRLKLRNHGAKGGPGHNSRFRRKR